MKQNEGLCFLKEREAQGGGMKSGLSQAAQDGEESGWFEEAQTARHSACL